MNYLKIKKMKNKISYLFVIFSLLSSACSIDSGKDTRQTYDTRELKLTSNHLTPETLWSFGRLGNVSVSPDKQTVVYTVSFPNIEENRSYNDVYSVPVLGGEPTQLTHTYNNEFDVAWRPDGKKISFLSSESGSVQLWEMEPDGSLKQQISDVEGGITGYKYSPSLRHIAYTKPVKLGKSVQDIYPDLPKANARIDDDLMYRHWDSWHDYHYSHIFITPFEANSKFTKGVDIMGDEAYDAPLKPFGGMEQIEWSPCGLRLIYACKKLTGKAYAVSTNSDVYLYDLNTGETKNISEGMMGYDLNPMFSPDGSLVLWESMARDGYEADKNRLMVMNVESDVIKDYSLGFDQNVTHPVWDNDGDFIWFISNRNGTEQIYLLNLADGSISKITDGIQDFTSVIHAGESLIASRVSMSSPADVFRISIKDGSAVNLTNINKHLMNQLTMGEVEGRWVETTDKKQMQVWIIYPPDFDPTKKYPTILYCQGGPQSGVTQFWSYRWNFQMMAANGYIVVAPNRRGLPGFGQEWNEQISGDYGGQNMKDYLSAIDEVAKEPFVDEARLGAVGASYGGYSVYWLAGNHNKRFKAFISHCGVFNQDMMYSTTEEMFFVDWDLGGAYWNLPNKGYDFSPHRFVGNWDTPLLVIHGGKDFRIPYTQGMGAFNSARMRDIPARFLFFPEENHWVLSAQNGILWQREFFRWMDHWLK